MMASTLLLSLVSCGNKKSNSKTSGSVVNTVCDNINCMSSIDWKIFLQGQVFPKKSRLEINGETVLDECLSKQQYRIDRESAPQSITLGGFIVPKQGQVRLRIVDQGWDCSDERTFIQKENVPFEVVKTITGREIVINL